MKIDGSSLQLSSRHQAYRVERVEESLRMWRGDPPAEPAAREAPAVRVDISEAGRCRSAGAGSQEEALEPRLQVLVDMLEALTGRRIRLFDASDLSLSPGTEAALDDLAAAGQRTQSGRVGWGIEYQRHEYREEAEQTSLHAEGRVRTADGREIRLELDLQMNRRFVEENHLSLRAGDAVKKDPLVVNLDGGPVRLTQDKLAFDLDADGRAEQVSFVGSGSAFLALDRNGNGRIDDGSELFGAKTGDGFAELAALDADGNRWIDENDAAYRQLRLWSRDAEGVDRLATLAGAGVGALYLDRVATPFEIKDSAHALQGAVRSSGLYLAESGAAGTLQQIDLVV